MKEATTEGVRRSIRCLAALGASAVLALVGLGNAAPAHAATCSDVDVVFARATGEAAGLGSAGAPLVSGLKSALSGKSVTSYAVNYPADFSQTQAGTGATDMANHVNSTAARCPNTKFVLGGYSQGASVTDIAIGIRTFLGTGGTISSANASHVSAIVVFGNPLGTSGQTIERNGGAYASKAKSFCNFGDPVCQAGGFNIYAHLTYPFDGSVTQAVTFAAGKVNAR